MVELNWIAILIATVATMVIGSVWYSPKVLGNAWIRLGNIKTQKKITNGQAVYLYSTAFLGSLVTITVLAIFTDIVHSYFDGVSFLGSAVWTALILWAGFTAARIHMHDTFANFRKKFTLINVAHELVNIVVVALIIGLLPA